jgi:benzil reductase ((S)-benzoin forming)
MVMAAELDMAAQASPGQPDTSILSYEPGLVDTPMQTAVRTSPVETVPSVQMFKDFQTTGMLVAPAVPARVIADYLSADGHPRWDERRFDPSAQAEPAA